MFDIYEFINENELSKYEIKDLFKEFILTVYDELDKKGYEALMIKFKENLDENDLI